ncbi:MAG: hypothetical protein RBQ91_07070 [Acholeplasma sp.]|nr:hypothetical protein [Acholeplasma sp.]
MSEAKKRNQIKISEAMFYNHLMRRNPVIHFVNNNDKTYYDKYIKGTIAVQVDGREGVDPCLNDIYMKAVSQIHDLTAFFF